MESNQIIAAILGENNKRVYVICTLVFSASCGPADHFQPYVIVVLLSFLLYFDPSFTN